MSPMQWFAIIIMGTVIVFAVYQIGWGGGKSRPGDPDNNNPPGGWGYW